MSKLSSTVFDRSSGSLLRNMPESISVGYGKLVSKSWRHAYYDEINHIDRKRAARLGVFLGKLEDGSSEENFKLFKSLADQTQAGDVTVLTLRYDDEHPPQLSAVARGRMYTPRFKLRLKPRISRQPPYAYLPDALGHDPESLDTAINVAVGRLAGDQTVRVVVDALENDLPNQDMLTTIGFQKAGSQEWQSPELFVPYVGSRQSVVQFERTSA